MAFYGCWCQQARSTVCMVQNVGLQEERFVLQEPKGSLPPHRQGKYNLGFENKIKRGMGNFIGKKVIQE